MKKLLLALLVGLVPTSLFAQGGVNTVPQVGVLTAVNTQVATYRAVALALPPAASATDIACIAGSATKVVRVQKIVISGTAATLVTAPFTLLRRASVDTAGTAATTTANWANTISKLDTQNPAATATLISYSANPTINDTSPTYIATDALTIPVTSAGTSTVPLRWTFNDGFLPQMLTLRGTSDQICINLNAVSIATGLLYPHIEWTEQ